MRYLQSQKKNITIYCRQLFEQKCINDLFNKSRIFLFTSIREGVAKVTGEVPCGLRILPYKNFRGNATYGIIKRIFII